MLKVMRENLKSLSWILGAVILAFVMSVFFDYGGQGNLWGGGSTGSAATVNGEDISVPEFRNAARNLSSYYRSLLGDAFDPERLNLNITQEAVNQLVRDRVVMAHARTLGLKATQEEIADELVNDPNLQGTNGFIGVDQYKNLLRSSGIDPVRYESELADRILRRKWAELVTSDIMVDNTYVVNEIRRRQETADVLYAHFRPDDFKDQVEAPEEEVAAYYEQNRDRYTRGTGRVFDILAFDRLKEQDELKITEDEIREEYGVSLQSRFTVPEQKRASHILIKFPEDGSDTAGETLQRAEAALRRVRSGEDFATVAQEVSEDSSASNGGDLGFFEKGVMTVPFEQAVWNMREIGEISDVVPTEFGHHIIKLTGTRESRLKPLEEVREELTQDVMFRKSGEMVRQRSEEFAATVRDDPESFRDEAARNNRLVIQSQPFFAGDTLPGIGYNPEVERALLALTLGEVSSPVATSRGYVVARYVEDRNLGAPAFDEVAAQVEEEFRTDKASQLAAARAEAALAGFEAGEASSLTDLGETGGFTVEEALTLTRGLSIGTLGSGPELERALFEGEIGKLVGPVEVDSGAAIIQVTARNELSDEEIATQTPEVREQILSVRRQQAISAITRELTEAADVRINQELLQALEGNAPAAAPAS